MKLKQSDRTLFLIVGGIAVVALTMFAVAFSFIRNDDVKLPQNTATSDKKEIVQQVKSEEQIKQENLDAEKERIQIEKEEVQIKKIKAKYQKLIDSGLYQYELISKLHKDNFILMSTELDKAPDGSIQPKQMYQKDADGFRIIIYVQSAYDLQSFYANVLVL